MLSEHSSAVPLLAWGIAKYVMQTDGLIAVYLPRQVDGRLASGIVHTANALKVSRNGDVPAYAVVVNPYEDSKNEYLKDDGTLVVSVAGAIRYRIGDRLVVVHGESADLESFRGVFRSVIGPEFPARSRVAIDSVAHEVVCGLAAAAQLDESSVGGIAPHLSLAMRTLADVLRDSEDPQGNWTARWYQIAMVGLDTLRDSVSEASKSAVAEDFESFVTDRCYGVFGLPHPDARAAGPSFQPSRKLLAAFKNYWGSTASAEHSQAMIAEARHDAENPAVIDVCWDRLDDLITECGSIVQAVQLMASESSSALNSFSSVMESEFLSPEPVDSQFEAYSDSGQPLEVRLLDGARGRSIASSSWDSRTFAETEVVRLRLEVPNCTLQDLERTQAEIRSAQKGCEFTGTCSIVDSGLEFAGSFRFRLSPERIKDTKLTVSLYLPPTDSLSGRIGSPTITLIVIPPVDSACMVCFSVSAKGDLAATSNYLGPRSRYEHDSLEEVWSATSKAKRRTFIVLQTEDSISHQDGVSLRQIPNREGLYTGVVDAGASCSVTAADHEFKIEPELQGDMAVSPLRAAALKCALDTESFSMKLRSDVRAIYERYFSGTDVATKWGNTFGHVVASSESLSSSVNEIQRGKQLLTLGCTEDDVPALVNRGVFDRSGIGDMAKEFEEAFQRLAGVLWKGKSHDQWISRTSLRGLWEEPSSRDLLDDYLDTYSALVHEVFSKRGHPDKLTRIISAYPCSISVWKDQDCQGVYISPLHPIRLAWLASAEATLYKANDAARLIGMIEGWKFPFVGPGPKRTRMLMSTPIDSGFEEVFAGWELLVPTEDDETREIVVPQTVAGIPAPGASSSGLTASAVDSAIREYLRVYPQSSSLSIDLAASRKTERVAEIDGAVLDLLSNPKGDEEDLLGITVQDSSLRDGEPPLEGLAKLEARGEDRRLTWLRYDPSVSDTLPPAKIRFQSDSLLGIGCSDGEVEEDAAVISQVPLRRFVAEYPKLGGQDLVMHPNLNDVTQGSSSFERALLAFERSLTMREIRIAPRELTVPERTRVADWTIAGESLISPTAVQDVLGRLSGGSNKRMLWEWRPPIFESVTKSVELESRGYVALSKIPQPLVTKIDEKLSQALGPRSQSVSSGEVFRQLGARGVGLASLLTSGDKQASGAIGFYLALALCDQLRSRSSFRVVVPIDSSQGFLDVLSGDDQRMTKRRADLLMIDLAADAVTFIPIEVKMYGLSSTESNTMPDLNRVVEDAVDQVRASRDQLNKIATRRDFLGTSADTALWNNALATLLETALKLAPPRLSDAEEPAADLRKIFYRVLSGEIGLQVGSGLVMCFSAKLSGSAEWHRGLQKAEADGISVVRATPLHVIELEDQSRLLADACSEAIDLQVGNSWEGNTERPHHEFLEEPEDSAPLDESGACPPEPLGDNSHVESNELNSQMVTSPEASLNSESADLVSGLDAVGEEYRPIEPNRDVQGEALSSRGVGLLPNASSEQPTDPDDESQTAEIELIYPGVKFPVGTYNNTVGTRKPELWLGNTSLNQLNIGVVGDLGTGKTQLVKSLMAQVRYNSAMCQSEPASILVFDYKHDYCDDEFIEKVGGVVLKPEKIPVNLFALDKEQLDSRQAREQKIGGFIDVLSKIYSGIGPKQKRNLKKVLREGYELFGTKPPTLEWVYERYEELHGADSVLATLDGFVNMEVLDDGSDQTMTFDELLEGKVLVLDLNSLGTDNDLKNSLVVLFLNLYYDRMKRMEKHPFLDGEPSIRYVSSYVVVDEATNIMDYEFPVLEHILLEGREFGVGVLLSSQYLTHFKTKHKNWAEPLLTWFVHKVPTITERDLKQAGITTSPEIVDQIPTLKVHEALYKSLGPESRLIRGMPFYLLKDQLSVEAQRKL